MLADDLATVDTDVIIRVELDHPDPSALTITLTNPDSNEVMVWDQELGPVNYPWFEFDGEFVIHRSPVGFSADESVNGTWTLKIVDAGDSGGTLKGWGLEIMSRFD
nr:proprotein convertase P-domain-containing protein [Pseudenhygromyxa sp. WMMC2535]